jgi:hypothetical protein
MPQPVSIAGWMWSCRHYWTASSREKIDLSIRMP